jgi:Calx-beta domain
VSGLPSSDPVTLQFDASSYSAAEHDGTGMAIVTRTGDPVPAVDVMYATSDDSPAPGSATAGADYSTVFGELNFGCGDTSESFTVPVHTDGAIEDDEVLDLTLSAPTAPASLGTPSVVELTITDTTAQPDGSIKRSADVGYVGDNVYDDGTNQLVKQKVKQGQSRIFDVRIENDGQPIDEFGIQGPGSNNKFKITYLQSATEVTDQVVAGDYFTGFLSTGGSHELQVQVKVKNSANSGDTKTLSILATSENDPAQTDTVRAKVKAK